MRTLRDALRVASSTPALDLVRFRSIGTPLEAPTRREMLGASSAKTVA